MCLAIPVKVIDLLPDDMAKVSLDGVTMVVSIALVPEVAVGDYVVLHVGYALARIDEEEATRTLALLGEAARTAQGEVAP
jgi:hydrogenase expression/formation protein HypC